MRIFLFCLLLAAAPAMAQLPATRFSLHLKQSSLEEALQVISRKTGASIIYTREQLKNSLPVTMHLRNTNLLQALDSCLQQQPLGYRIEGEYIVLTERKPAGTSSKTFDQTITGRVLDEEGKPIAGASISSTYSSSMVITDENGRFRLESIKAGSQITASAVGFHKQMLIITNSFCEIRLRTAVTQLDETVVIAYGSVSKRMNTGNVSKLQASELERQPVSNPLAALQGRMPGLLIRQSSGVAGSAYRVEIRGKSSIDPRLSRNDPLFVIDGVPFEAGNLPAGGLVSAANEPGNEERGGLSPLNILSPSAIESIEVLKDADATAIYGSRGANGVILITTKKATTSKSSLGSTIYSGWLLPGRAPQPLPLADYLALRKEALVNDGLLAQVFSPFADGYAPDLLLWDSLSDYDHKSSLIGHTASVSEARLSWSGSNDHTSLLAGANYHRENSLFSSELADRKQTAHLQLRHNPGKKKLSLQLSMLYGHEKNNSLQQDLTQYIFLPPNLPLYTAEGFPNWIHANVPIEYLQLNSPAAVYLRPYQSITHNLLSSVSARYLLGRRFSFNLNAGYNFFSSNEVATIPATSLSPLSTETASAYFAKRETKNWIVEPHVSYTRSDGPARLELLVGLSFQQKNFSAHSIAAGKYSSDDQLNSPDAAGSLSEVSESSAYRYGALFARANYHWRERYLANLTVRRDGSSRFSPQHRWSNFGALAIGWIFSKEKFLPASSLLSFGKLRVSFGLTGNDQIGDYRFLDIWTGGSSTYLGIPSLAPARLYNPDLHWERTRKLEVALELGFCKDRIFFTAAYYHNLSSDQLINYRLPDQTGFSTIIRNFPALVRNSGFECAIDAALIRKKKFSWSMALNMSLPRNRLLRFPGLELSPYADQYVVGASLGVINGFRYLGVDPQTGLYRVADRNLDGILNREDYQISGNADAKLFGGWENKFTCRRFELSIFFEGSRQTGRNELASIITSQPGTVMNQAGDLRNRWQHPGDRSRFQKAGSRYGSETSSAAFYLGQSDGIYGDASYLRLKNLCLYYSISNTKQTGNKNIRFYLQSQNLLLITSYKGADPEIQNALILPVPKTIVAGMQIQLQ